MRSTPYSAWSPLKPKPLWGLSSQILTPSLLCRSPNFTQFHSPPTLVWYPLELAVYGQETPQLHPFSEDALLLVQTEAHFSTSPCTSAYTQGLRGGSLSS